MQNPWHTAQSGHRIAFTDGRIFTVIAWSEHTYPDGQTAIEPLLCVPGYIDLRTVTETGEFWRHLPPGTPEPSRQDWEHLRHSQVQELAREARGIDEVGNAIQATLDHLALADQAELGRTTVEPEDDAGMGDTWQPIGPRPVPASALKLNDAVRAAGVLVRESFGGVEPAPAPQGPGDGVQPSAGVGEGEGVGDGSASLGGQV
jgi:hypothetical protein